MSTLRVLVYMFGAWVGGILVAALCAALFSGAWSYTVLWTVLACALAGGLFRTLYLDPRTRSRAKPR